jgi:F-type H+-transporting ATPase subunit a
MGEILANYSNILASAEGAHGEGLSIWGLMLYMGFVLAIIFGLMAYAKKDLKSRVFYNPIAQGFEQAYLFIEGMCLGTIGPRGRKYLPFIMVLWLVIFTGNIVALFCPSSPTADLSFNLAMAVMAVFYVQWEGIRQNGVLGHFRHFAGPNLGHWVLLPISLIIFAIEIISELMKNVSLSLRLFGNIDGGHQAVLAMNALGERALIPVGAFLIPLKLLTCIVQAMIFTLLTCVYLSLVTHEKEHDSDNSTHEAAATH